MHREQIIFQQLPVDVRLRSVRGKEAPKSQGADEAAIQARQQTRKQDEVYELLCSIQTAIEELELRRQQSLRELRRMAIELAVAAASHIVDREIRADCTGVESLISSAVLRLPVHDGATVFLNPQDLAMVESARKETKANWNTERFRLVADHNIQRGGVRLESSSGRILQSDVAIRMAEIRQCWMERIDESENGDNHFSADS